jgi:hypothetical protein
LLSPQNTGLGHAEKTKEQIITAEKKQKKWENKAM